jgi:hypothetical protein
MTLMNFANYDFAEIKAAADCVAIARELGITVSPDGRCAATWRGGTNPTSVSINRDGWHDFSQEESGSVIDLVAKVMFGGMVPMAQNWLGERLHLTPKSQIKSSLEPTRYDRLLGEGYSEVCRYRYTDAAGTPVQFVVRLHHPTKPKEFLQCDAAGRWSVKHVEPVLYNLPAVSASSWAVVVEGEKDADTLIAWQIPGTTNAGGSKKWQDSFSDALAGKDVVLCPDNDEVGQHHMNLVGKSLFGKAKSIRMLSKLSKLPKGDVTDWRDKEGGTAAKFLEIVSDLPAWEPPHEDKMALAAAKEANQTPFSNFNVKFIGDGQKRKAVKEARTARALLQDLDTRFLGFPRKVGGDTLFDHDRDTGEIRYIDSPSQLFAWMQFKSNNRVAWAQGDDLLTKGEFFDQVRTHARKYESISPIPDYPTRSEVYYSHPPLPEPSEGHRVFEGLIDFFNPATPAFRTLLSALFCAPLYYVPGVDRPMWIIDSIHGQGTGKSTVAKMLAFLYGSEVFGVEPADLKGNMEEVVKRALTNEGRCKRVFLVDNVTGNFRSPELARLVTSNTLNGMKKYGKDEENRPNNFTYIITSNNAKADTDIIVRSFFVDLQRQKLEAGWVTNAQNYIRTHRLQILSDAVDRIRRGCSFDAPIETRFPEFEKTILHPQCKTWGDLKAVSAAIREKKDEANHDLEFASEIEEMVMRKMSEFPTVYGWRSCRFWIPSTTLFQWARNDIDDAPEKERVFVQTVKEMVMNGTIKSAKIDFQRFPSHSTDEVQSKRGLMWYGPQAAQDSQIYVITYDRDSQRNSAVKWGAGS